MAYILSIILICVFTIFGAYLFLAPLFSWAAPGAAINTIFGFFYIMGFLGIIFIFFIVARDKYKNKKDNYYDDNIHK